MKKLILLLALSFYSFHAFAQSAKGNRGIMKVSYVGTSLSPNMVSVFKSSISSPDIYKQTISLLEKYKYYYSLYINLENNESAYVLDSIHVEPGVAALGHINKVFTDSSNNFWGTEEFLKSVSFFKGNLSDLKWKITNEEKEIGGHACTKILAEGHNDIAVWVCTDIPINRGPGYLLSPLGLVLEASDFFSATRLQSLAYIDSTDVINKVKEELVKSKTISFKEELKLKDNMIQTMVVDKEVD